MEKSILSIGDWFILLMIFGLFQMLSFKEKVDMLVGIWGTLLFFIIVMISLLAYDVAR
jgi:hypothetical protein